MRTACAVLLALALAACGGNSTTSPATGGTDKFPTGTLLGAAFTPAAGGALVLAPASCTIAGQQLGVSSLLLGFSSVPGLCGRAPQLCTQLKANEELVAVEVLKAGSGAQVAVGAGTYPITDQPTPDANGNLAFAVGALTQLDAQCQDQGGGVTLASGAVTLTAVGPTRVTGTLQATLSDGSTFAGDFDVSLCSATLDTCAVASSTCGAGASCQP